MRLGAHALDGSYAELELAHAGSRLRLRLAITDEGALAGDVEIVGTAEWGLRFWYVLEAGFSDPLAKDGTIRLLVPEGEAAYLDPPVATGTCETGAAAFATSIRPVNAFVYEDRTDVEREFEIGGYYARPPLRERGRWAAFRFNAVTPRVGFAAAVAEDGDRAFAEVRSAVAGVEDLLRGRSSTLQVESARRAAVRDVLGWNTVWDPANRRAYTVATRGWVATKFGGWIVWQSDAFLHAVMGAELGARETAIANLDAALSLATARGNLAALASGVTSWVDRSHPPIGALATWWAHRRLGALDVLERAYPVLSRAHDWWFEERDGNRNGLLEYGSSPVGDGHFVHTKLAAMDESAMDNSPVHDEAEFRVDTHTLDVEDVGLNSLLVLEGTVLARIAAELGRADDTMALRDRSSRLADMVRTELWDPDRRIFANRRWDGAFVRSHAPTSFYPMLAGIATDEQARLMVEEHLLDSRRFGGEWPVAGTPHDDSAAADNVYWRGRVWPPLNLLVYLGVRRYGMDEAAAWLAARGEAMFQREWRARRSFENFNQRTGEGGDSPDADPFYTWGALLPLIADLDARGTNPWDDLGLQ